MKNKKHLVIRAQAGDVEAFNALVRSHYTGVLDQACRYLGDFHLAEDAVQDAFVYAYLNVSKLREPEAFSGWLRRIVAGCCNRLRRGKHLPVVSLDVAQDVVSLIPDPDENFEARDIRKQIQNAILRLPERERPMVTLFYVGDYSQKEIAALLDVPLSTANSRLYTSRQRLRQELMMEKPSEQRQINKKRKFEMPSLFVPIFPVPNEITDSEAYLRQIAQDGLVRRYVNVSDVVQQRLDFEIDVIVARGCVDYFLIFQDLIDYARRVGICIGPGRGPVSSSLLAYVLGITDVDPLQYHLIFERFLNPEYSTVPDIDLDVDPERREELFDYLVERYPEALVSRVVPFGFDQSLDVVNKTASVILLAQDQAHRLPTVKSKDGIRLSQIDEATCAAAGLMKVDLLGLKELTSIGRIVHQIRDKESDFDLSKIPMDDVQTMGLFAEGNTSDIFLFDGEEMQRHLRNFQPNCFADLVHLYAIYSKTPERVLSFIDSRKDRAFFEDSPSVWGTVLDETCGLWVYQEQFMEAARCMAGFTYAQADRLRRALNKGDVGMREGFLKGCVKHGIERKAAEQYYDVLKRQVKQLFNQSHAVTYVLIAYRLAYLKTHYPEYF